MMIVKDEASIIRACLESARPFIDWWVISDTGSTDGTQEIISSVLAGIPGDLVESPWVDFGHNRQVVLDLARASPHRSLGDYACWIDADQQFTHTSAVHQRLTADGHTLTVSGAGATYSRLAIIALDQPWRWRGVLHEHLELAGAVTTHLDEPRVHDDHNGARSRDPHTYRKDAALLETALLEDPGNPRLQFYLAQSWKDAGEPHRALTAYQARVANPAGWDQETWYARLQVGSMLERTDAPPGLVIDAYLDAYDHDTSRAEPLVELARFERGRERYESALLFARPATRLAHPPATALFVDESCYTWRAWDEVAVSSYWAGRYDDGVLAASKALEARPDDERLQANLEWCQRGLAAG